MRKIGYARVSTSTQNLDRQIGALRAERCHEVYREKASGKAAKGRPQLEKAIGTSRCSAALSNCCDPIWRPPTVLRGSAWSAKYRRVTAAGRGLGPGIDVRADGGFVVAPPSELPNGRYRWLIPPMTTEFPTLADWAVGC